MVTLHKQDEYIKTALRLPRDLHARIQKEAETHGRSMNAEIIARLATSFVLRAGANPKEARDAISSLESTVARQQETLKKIVEFLENGSDEELK